MTTDAVIQTAQFDPEYLIVLHRLSNGRLSALAYAADEPYGMAYGYQGA